VVELDVKRSRRVGTDTLVAQRGKNKNRNSQFKIIDPRTNFCGAYWSDGKFQSSVKVATVEPVNELDATCRDHDVAIANAKTREDVLLANDNFYNANYGKSTYRTVLAIAVKYLYPFGMPPPSKKNNSTPTMRSVENAVSRALVVYDKNQKSKQTNNTANKNKNKKKKKKTSSSMITTSLPATIGTTLTGIKPVIQVSGGRTRITGREFVTSLPENNQTNWFLSALFPIHPAYFKATVLANYCRSFERFTFNGGAIHYITRQPTSATGEVLMYSTTNVAEANYSYNSTSFLSVAFGLKNAVMGPIWSNHSMRLPAGRGSGLTNPLTEPDINDNLKGEVAIYTQSGVTDTAGFILFDYDFTFHDPMYTVHAGNIPITTGATDIKLFADAANEVIGTQAALQADGEFGAQVNGTIFKMVLNVTGTTFGGVTSANTSLRIVNGTASSTVTLVDGFTCYGVIVGTSLLLWPTLSTAKEQSTTVFIGYYQSITAKSTWAFSAYQVQMGTLTQALQD